MSDLQLTFADCAELVSAKVHPKNVAQETPYIGLEHIVENGLILNGMGSASDVDSQKSVFKKGDILFGKLRPYFRKVVIAPCDGICSTDIWVVRPKVNTDRNFLFYWMGSKQFIDDTTRASEGTKMPRAKWNFAAKFKKPECKNEKEIGLILRSLDKKIALNRQINQTLESMAQVIFKSWFVDFDPVKAKIAALESGEDAEGVTRTAMRAISGKTDDELDKMQAGQPEDYAQLKTTAELFPEAIQDSELGEVPEGWRVGNILDCANLLSGGTPKTKVSEYWSGEIPWVSAKDVTNARGSFIFGTEKTITQLGINNSSAKLLPKYTTIVTARGTVGSYCILSGEMAINQSNYGLKSKFERGDFFVFFSVSNLVIEMKKHSYGTVFDTITTKTFKEIEIAVPPESVIQHFDEKVNGLMNNILLNLDESNMLAIIRDTFLPKLMCGEIRV
ncbi:MAG: restriction endonuclease subunit S [Clostridiales bacterium]|nr:restriction endonuclease subunit S [Clostridiales bacterium]